MNKKQAKELGVILVNWNIGVMEPKEAMYRVSKLFPRIFIRSWREYLLKKNPGELTK